MSSLVKKDMCIKMTMEGTVNGHHFKCVGEGEGKPFEGTQVEKIRITEGGPLPFAYDILAPCCMYGSKTFIKHVSGIPDYFKDSLPEGFTWERTQIYEDGGYLTIHQDTSIQGDSFIFKVKVIGANFPANGPVMQKKTAGWEPCVEMLYPRDGVLCGQSLMALKCTDGNHLTSHLRTTYRSRKPANAVNMPKFHFGDHRIEILKEAEPGKFYEQYESAVARYCEAAPSKLGHH
uniref:Blue chromoprotein 2 n=1 Tax=Actinia tenebrosa TaxID=6105 RepID=A0A1D7XF02_ACTTE|nr:blue chromoprotein 2 [Actinia tenebrosa]